MIEHHVPVLQVIVPLIAAPLCVLLRERRIVLGFSIVVTWVTFALSVSLTQQVLEVGTVSYELGGWAAPYGIVYRVDALGAFVTLFVSAIGAMVLSYAPRSLAREIPENRHYLFCATYLLCLAGLLGIAVTGDLFNVFVFLEISSLSSYALISLGSDRKALTAAFQYLVMGTIGATFILIGIGLMYMVTGTLNMIDMAERIEVFKGMRTVLVAFAFEEITVSTTVKILTRATWKPTDGTGAVMAFITFADAAARFNVDGSVPSTTSGHIAADASSLKICTDSIGKFQVIRDDGTDVEMSVSYYRYPQ